MPNKFEELGAKGAGMAKAGVAALKGMTGVFRTIAEQHGEVTAMLNRARLSSDGVKRIDLWSKIRKELLSHERAELSVVFPVFHENEKTRAFALEHDRESGELESAIRELDGIDATTDAWNDKLVQLIALVQHHADVEENEYFPVAMNVLGKARADELEQRFLASKEQAVEQLG